MRGFISSSKAAGSIEVWLEGDNKRHFFEWQKGSLFSIPVNAMHRIVNASSSPALLLGVDSFPPTDVESARSLL